ncbi:hypothetical protein MKZ38_007926 [Zalerion maritima]|uniref:Uncharacterized protein n=1 Tax=Zalerion maritima TaxID=339359 RepID=A0AAD5WMQ9_9PEZI|nr:hypothetical protein MKZ38_007926 [Zalerion maritima]
MLVQYSVRAARSHGLLHFAPLRLQARRLLAASSLRPLLRLTDATITSPQSPLCATPHRSYSARAANVTTSNTPGKSGQNEDGDAPVPEAMPVTESEGELAKKTAEDVRETQSEDMPGSASRDMPGEAAGKASEKASEKRASGSGTKGRPRKELKVTKKRALKAREKEKKRESTAIECAPPQDQSLLHAFYMVRRSLNRTRSSMLQGLMFYKTLETSTAPVEKTAKVVQMHLERAQTALRLLDVMAGRKLPSTSKKEITPDTPPSELKKLGDSIRGIIEHAKLVQRNATRSVRSKSRLADEISKVLATTSILRSLVDVPKTKTLLRKGVPDIETVIAQKHSSLLGEVQKAYPDLVISVNDTAPDDSKQAQSTGTEEATKTDDSEGISGSTEPAAGPNSSQLQGNSSSIRLRGIPSLRLEKVAAPEEPREEAVPTKGRRGGRVRFIKSGPRSEESGLKDSNVETINSQSLELTPVEILRPPIPRLSYGLDRVLFNPGVYQLKDTRTGVFNFDPYLDNIMPITEFDFGALQSYITSSKDTTLIDLASAQGKKYTGSTSSMTAVLSHFHYLLSAWRPLNPGRTTRVFSPESVNFTRIHRTPAAVFLHSKDGTHAIDADKEYDRATILSMLGQSMEKLFTSTREEFEQYRKSRSHELSPEKRRERTAYNYTTMGDFMMRSQLDAKDDRLPGTGVFDLKTRAVISIRMDSAHIAKALGYEICQRFGNWESYEREYYDLVRSAFLKYSLQARMGRMDGIFVAYHNAQSVFGFQYFPLGEMDYAIHGTDSTHLGNHEFKLSIHLLNKALDRATERFPGRSLRLHFETRPSEVQPFMYIFAKPVTPEEIHEIQTANQESVTEFERNILGIFRDEEDCVAPVEDAVEATNNDSTIAEGDGTTAESPQPLVDDVDGSPEEFDEDLNAPTSGMSASASWEELRSRINEAIEKDELGVDTIRDAVENALEQSGLMPTDCGQADAKLYVDTLMELLRQSIPPESTQEPESPESEGEYLGQHSPDRIEEVATDEESPTEEGAPTDDYQAPRQVEDVVTAEESMTEVEEAPKDDLLDSDRRVDDIGNKAMEADLEAASVPHEQLQVAALRALLLLRQQPAQQDGEDNESNGQNFARVQEFERILSSALVDHMGQDDHLHRLPHPSAPITPAEERTDELIGFNLVIRNKVDGVFVDRPTQVKRSTTWEVEYSINEIPDASAQRLYQMVLQRRKKELEAEDKDAEWYRMFQGQLHKLSTKGREKRAKRFRNEFGRDVVVYGEDTPRKWHEAFEASHVEEQMRAMGKAPRSLNEEEERTEEPAEDETGK